MSRTAVLTDDQWERIRPFLPSSHGKKAGRSETTAPWWRASSIDTGAGSPGGTSDKILASVLSDAQKARLIAWAVSADSTTNRAHQHATNLTHDTGGRDELHESVRGAG